jgi:hypothetical protein
MASGKSCTRLAKLEHEGHCAQHRPRDPAPPVLSVTCRATNIILTGGPVVPGQVVRVTGTWRIGAEQPVFDGTKWTATPVEVDLVRDLDAPLDEADAEVDWWSAEATQQSLARWEDRLATLRQRREGKDGR